MLACWGIFDLLKLKTGLMFADMDGYKHVKTYRAEDSR